MITKLGKSVKQYLPESTNEILLPFYIKLVRIERRCVNSYYSSFGDKKIIENELGFKMSLDMRDKAQRGYRKNTKKKRLSLS